MMKKFLIYILFIFSILFVNNSFGVEKQSSNILLKNCYNLSPMLKKVLPSVVNIHVKGIKRIRKSIIPKEFKYFFGFDIIDNNKKFRSFESVGSGVLINSKKGYIITNNHVIKKAKKITIQLSDGREFQAKLIGFDKKIDLALLKIPKAKNLTQIKISNSDLLHVGDFALAIGNPFGLGQTVTSGIISALDRNGFNKNGLENFIQTDAAINKGNSGGALINIKGELIGINTAILTPGIGNIGIGFAIPSNIVKKLSNQFISFGKFKRGKLGIKGIEINKDIAEIFKIKNKKGVFVSEVISKSPAEKSGIKSGDIIISINNKPINNFSELLFKISTNEPGKILNIGILRNKKKLNIKVIIGENSYISQDVFIHSLKGSKLINGKSKENIQGVLVKNIIQDSPAWFYGLRKYDLIVEFNNKKIQNIDALQKNFVKNNKIILLKIIRKKSNVFLILS